MWSIGSVQAGVSIAVKAETHTLQGVLSMLDSATVGANTVIATCDAVVSNALEVAVTDNA